MKRPSVSGGGKVLKSKAEQAMPTLCEKWATETAQPWPPDSEYNYSFVSFWTWLVANYRQYSDFRAEPNARYVAEMWFEKITRQVWRN
jgi:hypothetical protein